MTAGGPSKYLFDRNNFDAGAIDPNALVVPTFSEEELEAARSQGFAEGLKQGQADAMASRAQTIAQHVGRLSTHIETLLKAEDARAQQFETELLSLTRTLFAQAFPLLNTRYGTEQIVDIILNTLRNLNESTDVVIEVSSTDLEEITDALRPLLNTHGDRIVIQPGIDLHEGDFRMKWKDGGALRDTQQLAQQIVTALSQSLAQDAQKDQTNT